MRSFARCRLWNFWRRFLVFRGDRTVHGHTRWRLGQFAGADSLDLLEFRATINDHVVDAGDVRNVDGLVDNRCLVHDDRVPVDRLCKMTDSDKNEEPVLDGTVAHHDVTFRAEISSGWQRRPADVFTAFAPTDPRRAPF